MASQEVKKFNFLPSEKFHHVEIQLQPDRVIHIDSITLRRCSEYFAKSLSDFWLSRNPDHAKAETKVIYELRVGPTKEDDFLMLKSTPELDKNTENGKPAPSRGKEYFIAYQNLFKIFSLNPPEFSCIGDVKELIEIADKYVSLHAIAHTVKGYLLDDPAELGYSIFSLDNLNFSIYCEPMDFIWIGEKLQCTNITLEASVHIIGNWPEFRSTCRNCLSNKLFGALLQVAKNAQTKMALANAKLLSLDLQVNVARAQTEKGRLSAALNKVREGIRHAFCDYKRCWEGKLYQGEDWNDVCFYGAGDLYAKLYEVVPCPPDSAWNGFETDGRRLRSLIHAYIGDLADNLSSISEDMVDGLNEETYLFSERLSLEDLPWIDRQAV